jgi:hypothetical protein
MKPVFDKRIFWDVNFETLDIDAKADYVITRVFERGDIEDIRQCRRYYDEKIIEHTLLNARFLPEQTMHFASAIIDKDIKEFRCYKNRQLNPGLFPY